MKRLVLIDAANALYRAFFALPQLRSPEGAPTGAVLGLANMLRKVLREEQPDAVAVAMDPPGGGFRRREFPEYKAKRDAQPEALSAQLPVMRELFDGWNIPLIEVADFEADDVIATLVRKVLAANAKTKISIVSTDKDLMQLVGERVVLLDAVKDRRIGREQVQERFGVPPEQLLDTRALAGDSSDNIPGVAGIGEKGAAKLIAEWGDLNTLLQNAAQVKAKRAREALLTGAEAAHLAKRLAALRDDVELPVSLANLKRRPPNWDALRALYRRLGFTRLLADLDGEAPPESAAPPAPPQEQIAVQIAANEPELEAALQKLANAEAVAVALVGEGAPLGMALAASPQRACYIPLSGGETPAAASAQPDAPQASAAPQPELGAPPESAPPEESAAPPLALNSVLRQLRALFEGAAARPWIALDSKRLQTLLAKAGVQPALPHFDVEVGAFLVDPAARRGLPALSETWLQRALPDWQSLRGSGAKARPLAEVPLADAAQLAGSEACALLALAPLLRAKIAADGSAALFDEVELPLTRVLSRMERRGVRVDAEKLRELGREYAAELKHIEARVFELAEEEFAVASPKQLQKILFEKLKLPAAKKTRTGWSTDESVLEQLAALHALPAEVLAWRRLSKLKSTYVDAILRLLPEPRAGADPRGGRIHPAFHQTGAATGRLSASHPNVQNIPIRTEQGIRVREAFIPAEGCVLLSADYSQVELRVMAHYSADENLLAAFARGEDIHRRTAAEVNGVAPEAVSASMRAAAKAVNFGIIYGSSAFGIARQLGVSQTEARRTIERYFERYQGVRRFLDDTIEQAREAGHVRTLLGRRRYLPDLGSRNRALRQAAERAAVNSVIQGTAADLIKKAMVAVDAALAARGMESQMILQVHDELVFETPEAEVPALSALVRECMEHVCELAVPLLVEVGTGANWRDAH